MQRDGSKCIAFAQKQIAELGLADARRVRQHSFEHRLQLAGRTRDDLQHLRGRGLLLQRLGKFARARLHLLEQPHILDRDHRLVGEGRNQLDLLVGKWSRRATRDHAMTPIGNPFSQQGHAKGRREMHRSCCALRSSYIPGRPRHREYEPFCLQARCVRLVSLVLA